MSVKIKKTRRSPMVIICTNNGRTCVSLYGIMFFVGILLMTVVGISIGAGFMIRNAMIENASNGKIVDDTTQTINFSVSEPAITTMAMVHDETSESSSKSQQEISSIDIPTISEPEQESSVIEDEPAEESEEPDLAEEEFDEPSSTQFPIRSVETPAGFVEYNIKLDPNLQKITYNLAEEYNVRYSLILALMFRESGYNVDAINHNSNGTTDHGLMQINDCNAGLMEKNNLDWDNPEDNIEGGIIILRTFLDMNDGDENRALMAYQYGQAGMQKKYAEGIYSSTALERLYWAEDQLLTNGGI